MGKVTKFANIVYISKNQSLFLRDTDKPKRVCCFAKPWSKKLTLKSFVNIKFEPDSLETWSHLNIKTVSNDLRLRFACEDETINFVLALNWTLNQTQVQACWPISRYALFGSVLRAKLEFIAKQTIGCVSVPILLSLGIFICLK